MRRIDIMGSTGRSRTGRPRGTYLALGLLTLCAVFAATAGVRESLVTTTQALRQTLAAVPAFPKTITVSAAGTAVSSALDDGSPFGGANGALTDAQFTEITDQLHADYDGYDHGTVRLAPPSAAWGSMTSGLNVVQSALPKVGGTAVKLEVSYRQQLGQHMRLVAGHFPAPPAPAVPLSSGESGTPQVVLPGTPYYTPLMQVVVTQQTAATLGLRVGSHVQVLATGSGDITLQVSGIVVPADPDSAFWTADVTPVVPVLNNPDSTVPPPFWAGGVIAGPGEATAVQQDFGSTGLTMEWGLPLELGSATGQQAQSLANALTDLATQTPALSGNVAPVASSLSAASTLVTTLTAFLATAQTVDALLWLLYVSLAVTGLAALLLAARMVALRQSAELALIRARGASLWQVSLAAGRPAAIACVPAAVIAVALAVLAVPGAGSAYAGSAGGWWPQAAIAVVAIGGPALLAAWQHRLPRRRAVSRRQPRGRVRLVAELTLVAAAVAGIVVFRQQGTAPGAGVNLYTSAAPVLVAVPAVIVVLRIYPIALRGLLRLAARSAGAPAFLGLARAARTTLTPALPAFALVLALTVAAFAGMVRDAVTNGDVAASWKAVGADVTISGQSAAADFALPPAAVRAVEAVPGVTHATAEWPAAWLTSDGDQITVLAVDPASYATFVAATQGFPAIPAGLLSAAGTPGAAQPVLASPQAAADLGPGPAALGTVAAAVRPVTVRVAGEIAATPGWPAGGAFVIMPLAALKSAVPAGSVPVSELQLTGPGIDRARLDAVLRKSQAAGSIATFRSDVLAELTGAPLQHGAFLLFTLAVALAAVLGLAVMFLELALGTAEREATLARLATMGLGERQRVRVVALEVLPAVIAAAVAAWACALVLPRVVAPSIDLSVFNGTPISVPLGTGVSSFGGPVPLVPDVASVALPLAGLIVIAAAALWIEIRSGRRRRVTTALRIGG